MTGHEIGTRDEHLALRLELRRGLESFNGAYQLLDRAPHGRNEDELPVPHAWLRRHDQYDDRAAVPR